MKVDKNEQSVPSNRRRNRKKKMDNQFVPTYQLVPISLSYSCLMIWTFYVCLTGDPAIVTSESLKAVFVNYGNHPFDLINESMK
jgi:hypothetical protein